MLYVYDLSNANMANLYLNGPFLYSQLLRSKTLVVKIKDYFCKTILIIYSIINFSVLFKAHPGEKVATQSSVGK